MWEFSLGMQHKFYHRKYYRNRFANPIIDLRRIEKGQGTMKQTMLQRAGEQAEEIRQTAKSKHWKWIYAAGLLLGFLVFAVLGKTLIMESGLLHVDSLREVKDAVIDRPAFLQYVFRRRLLWLFVGILAWWWGFGKWYIYALLGGYGFVMGACLQTAMMRYSVKGIILWLFLYLPQAMFYLGVLFCGIILCNGVYKTRAEKITILLQKWLIILCMAVLYAMGIYCEGNLNVVLLQNYLQFF